MCRFVVYQGAPVRLDDLLFGPRHSLVAQSTRAERMGQCFNGDGFGVAWYPPGDDDGVPCVVKDTMPAWASRNLRNLAANVVSGRVFAHVRAASPGLAVQDSNTHPFQHGRYLFMHNGDIEGFRAMKRRLQQSLSDDSWNAIEGSTDSEHAFALVLERLRRDGGNLRAAMVGALGDLLATARACGASLRMSCNFALTDGTTTVVCRFAHGGAAAGSLHYSRGRRYVCVDGDGDMLDAGGPGAGAVLVASEPVTRRAEDWHEVPANHVLVIAADLALSLAPVVLAS